ncbi:MAG TPA: glycosyl hydrolase family 28-related protein, partial [Verrucomicrobiae bacterium]
QPKSTGTRFALNLSGGTVAAMADWSPAVTAPINLTNLNGTVTLQAADANGTAFDLNLAGPLNGVGGFTKTGGGQLTLTGTNGFTGPLSILAGQVMVTAQGSVAGTSGYWVSNGSAFTLFNGAAGNRTNRLSDVAALNLGGGSLNYLNDGLIAPLAEAAGALMLNGGTNVLTIFSATNLQTATWKFASLVHNGGVLDIQTSAAGTPQNQILFQSAPVLGSWLTVNGQPAAYDGNGLREATIYQELAALGSVLTNSPGTIYRFNRVGNGAAVQLGNGLGQVTYADTLIQNTVTPVSLDTAGSTLAVNQLIINAGAQPMIIGRAAGDGVLWPAQPGGTLNLINRLGQGAGLVINAAVEDSQQPTSLSITGGGSVTLAADANHYSGGTWLTNAALKLKAGTTLPMPWVNHGGTVNIQPGAAGASLGLQTLTLAGSAPRLAFDEGNGLNLNHPWVEVSGDFYLASDVFIDVTNPAPGNTVLLHNGGSRLGAGRVLLGQAPAGVGVVDDRAAGKIELINLNGPTVVTPVNDTNRWVVAVATPQQYGAVGDGVTDDSLAFQNAINAVYNSGGLGGGVIYIPAGSYVFSNSLTVPPGVTLQGDWADWSAGTNGAVGTLFKIYTGAGSTNGAPFLTLNQGALKGVNLWYPNQNPTAITPYPFTIYMGSGDGVVQDVALINAYQGIDAEQAPHHIIANVFGSPLFTGIQVDQEYDISHQENIRFSPRYWPLSHLPGAPAPGGPHAAWMRTNGVAERLYRCDGETGMNLFIDGYSIGYYGGTSAAGTPDTSFYGGYISNCATAFLDAAGGGNTGQEFTDFALDGDIAVDRNTASDASMYFHSCQLTGRNGVALRTTGGNSSTLQVQSSQVTGTVKVDGGVANFVNTSLTVAPGSNHCALATGAIFAGFTGCNFAPARRMSNLADSRRLLVDGRHASSSPLPWLDWDTVADQWLACRPAKPDLFVVTAAPYAAVGDGISDDTAAIQAALNAAAANQGGIVYLPPGRYKTTTTLDVPGGVELRGSFPSRHSPSLYESLNGGHVKASVLQPYGGANTTNGPPAIALEANAGILGLTISYELQNTNPVPFPPAIQGRGGNIYASGIMCANAFWYVDLNTYTCTNHFLANVDGWALQYGFTVGNGSAGSIVECMANSSYWIGNLGSASVLGSANLPQAPIQYYAEHNLQWFLLGDCQEW